MGSREASSGPTARQEGSPAASSGEVGCRDDTCDAPDIGDGQSGWTGLRKSAESPGDGAENPCLGEFKADRNLLGAWLPGTGNHVES